MKNLHRERLLASVTAAAMSAALAGTLGAAPALAQDEERDVIIVTAQKREADIQDVPISMTSVSAEQIQDWNLNSGTEIARATPNLQVSNLGNEDQPKFSMRGIATPDFDLNTTSPTGVFYDEVYVASQFLGGPQLFDLARVEVLRGPQGTLYGKNTTGGAINFITQAPTQEQEGYLNVQVGDNAYFRATGAVNLPLADTLAMRVAFNTSSSDGYVENHNPDGRDLSSIDNHAARLSLLWEPSNDFDATLRVFTSRAHPTNIGVINLGGNPDGTNAFGVNPRRDPITDEPYDNFEGFYDRTDSEIVVEGDGATLSLNKDLGPNFTLTSISNYTEGFFLNRVDADGSIAPLLHIDFFADTTEWSQDLRIASNLEGPFNFIAGLYYGHDEVDIRTDWNFFGGALIRNQTYDQERDSFAVYGDGTFDLTASTQLYGGARWTQDEGEQTNYQVLGAGADEIPLQPAQEYDDSAVTGRIGVRHYFTDDVMGYAQYARGYRSSAFNGSALFNPNDLNVSDPEELDAYEIGVKSQLLNNRLTLNSSVFFYQYRDQQFINTVEIGNSQVVNAGESEIYGIEIEAYAQITPELSVQAGLALLDTEFTELVLNEEVDDMVVAIDYSGNELIEAPNESLNVAVDYVVPMANASELGFHVDGNYVGDQFYSPRNLPQSELDGYWEGNARVFYARDNWEVGAFVKNFTDEDTPGGVTGDGGDPLFFIFRTPRYPRRFGVDLNVRF